MAHRIEYAPTKRSRCRTCKKVIGRGELRLAEEFVGEYSKNSVYRFHHLSCGADSRPYVLAPALKDCEIDIPGRDDLERRIAAALSVTDAAQHDETTALDYARFVALMNADPDDETAPLVFADWLQSVNDPRGELIMLQAAIEAAGSGERRADLRQREKELLRRNRRSFLPDESFDGSLSWRSGFIHRVKLDSSSDVVPEKLERLWRHPSMLLVRELVVDLGRSWTSLLPAPNLGNLPDSLALLDVDVGDRPIGAISETIETTPRLVSLRLTGKADIENLAHETLEELEIHIRDAKTPSMHQVMGSPMALSKRIGAIARGALPSLERLAIVCDEGADTVARVLARTELLGQLTDLELGSDLSEAGVKALTKALRGRPPLERLDISSNTRLSIRDRQLLAPLCEELVVPKTELVRRPEITGMPTPVHGAVEPIGDWRVRHTRKPEWGIGIVVEELEDKLVIDFESAGRKTIRGTELLEEV